ncbi:MAG: acyl-CoA reductase [Bacteroidetes bacterium]|nr:acyl-CoA reductase [Bacteroidota bacterium]
MNQERLIDAICRLGQSLSDSSNPHLEMAQRQARNTNPWFDEKSIHFALEAWAKVLQKEKIQEWLASEKINGFVEKPKTIGIVMAGNIPLVGMHDLLCVLLSGHLAKVKLSEDDKPLMQFIIQELHRFDRWFQTHLLEADKLNGIDAIIATGSNNTSRYFEFYFRNIPAIIRKNRNSLAILSGDESPEELYLIGQDVFMHYGLGCRNVTHLLIPRSDSPTRFYDHIADHYEVLNHNKYANNYTYHRALFLLNKQEHLDNNFLLMKEDDSLHSPVGCLNYSYYSNLEEVQEYYASNKDSIQVVISKMDLPFATVAPGKAQMPELNDYADGVNTLDFCYTV